MVLGKPTVQVGPIPPAGQEAILVVPAGVLWYVISITLTLTTSAAVGNRVLTLVIDDGASPLLVVTPDVVQAASTTVRYTFFATAPKGGATNASEASAPLPPGLVLREPFRVRTSTAALQAGDRYSALTLLVQQCEVVPDASGAGNRDYV